MSQTFPVNKFEWNENTTQFKEDFKKRCHYDSDEEHFLEVDIQYPRELLELHNDYHFYQKK